MHAETAHIIVLTHIFFHPDYTVGPGVSPSQRIPKYPVADFTASGESHPALKTKIQLFSSGDSIRQKKQKCNP